MNKLEISHTEKIYSCDKKDYWKVMKRVKPPKQLRGLIKESLIPVSPDLRTEEEAIKFKKAYETNTLTKLQKECCELTALLNKQYNNRKIKYKEYHKIADEIYNKYISK